MGKQEDLVAAVKDHDLSTVLKLTGKIAKSKLIGSAKKLNFNQVDSNGLSLLHFSATSDNVEILKILIEHGATVDAMDNQGVRPIHIAACQGNSRSVDHLISCGSSVNDPAFDGSTPLHMACEHGHLETVACLLSHRCDLVAYNREHKTAFDVACEFGHLKIVEKLVCSPQCGPLMRDYKQKARDIKRTTCLHLAARNGNVHILRFLLEVGFDASRQTAFGTCLHEAVMHGQIKAVKFLLDWGISLHVRNSLNQTALDAVHSSPKLLQNEKLVRLLSEAPFQPLTVRAVRSYDHCPQLHNQLSFREGDLIRVVERHSDETWKGYLFRDSDEVQQHVGYFPSSEVEVIHTADMTNDGPCSLHFSSQMSSSNLLPQYSASGHQCLSPVSQHLVKRSPASSSSSLLTDRADRTAEWIVQSADVVVMATECSSGSPMSSKDNVSESNRSSTSSSSGSSGYLSGTNQVNVVGGGGGAYYQPNRLSGQSCESGVTSLWPSANCLPASTSRSSHAGLDWLEEGGGNRAPVNVNGLLQQGLKDSEVMYAWLHQLQLTDCYHFFVQAGYDMPTISRMTPEDLTAIGITQPSVRKHLTSEISRLNLNDKVPNIRSNNLLEWLHVLNLEEYHSKLMQDGYTNIDRVLEITWEDLEDVGIHKLGHQKKLLLAIDRIKKQNSSGKPNDLEAVRHSEPRSSGGIEISSASVASRAAKPGNASACSETVLKKDASSKLPETASSSQVKNVIRLPPQTPFVHPSSRASTQTSHATFVAPSSEMIAIQVNRSSNSRTGSIKDRSGDKSDAQPVMYKSFHGDPSKEFTGRRVDNDGDMTPTNDRRSLSNDDAEDCLDGASDNFRPLAAAKPNQHTCAGGGVPGTASDVVACFPGRISHTQGSFRDTPIRNLDVGIAYNSAPTTPSHSALGGSPAGSRSKKIVPQPPKRSNSIKDKSTSSSSGVKPAEVTAAQGQLYADASKSSSGTSNQHQLPSAVDLIIDAGTKSKHGNLSLAEVDNPLSRVIARLEWKDDQVVRPAKSKTSDAYSSAAESGSAQFGHAVADCNTLPFANENIGTIKQRNPGKYPALSADIHGFYSSQDGSSSNCPASAAGRDSLQPKAEAKKPPPTPGKKQTPGKNETPGIAEQRLNQSLGVGADVFDDIDSLFQGLTQELNQMLTFND